MKTKNCYFFILILFSLAASAQVTTIKVRKEPAVCDFELIGDSSVFKDRICLHHYSIFGMPNNESDRILSYFKDYIRPKPLMMTRDSILPNITEICDLKNYKLKSVTVVKTDDNPKTKIDRSGNTWYYVNLKVLYEEKPKK